MDTLYRLSLQPLSLLFCQWPACGLTYPANPCILESEWIYNGLVDITFENLVETNPVILWKALHINSLKKQTFITQVPPKQKFPIESKNVFITTLSQYVLFRQLCEKLKQPQFNKHVYI